MALMLNWPVSPVLRCSTLHHDCWQQSSGDLSCQAPHHERRRRLSAHRRRSRQTIFYRWRCESVNKEFNLQRNIHFVCNKKVLYKKKTFRLFLPDGDDVGASGWVKVHKVEVLLLNWLTVTVPDLDVSFYFLGQLHLVTSGKKNFNDWQTQTDIHTDRQIESKQTDWKP